MENDKAEVKVFIVRSADPAQSADEQGCGCCGNPHDFWEDSE